MWKMFNQLCYIMEVAKTTDENHRRCGTHIFRAQEEHWTF